MKQTITNFERLLLIFSVVGTIYLLMERNNKEFKDITESVGSSRKLLAASDKKQGAKYDIVIGSIIMWSGSVDSIPENWALCNGSKSTPDLTDKFVIGAGNVFDVGDVGGQFNIILNTNQLPSHNHDHSHPISNNNINVGSDGFHKHDSIEGEIGINKDLLRHRHRIDTSTQKVGSHGHTSLIDVVDFGIGGAGLYNSPGGNQRSLFMDMAGAHSHPIYGYTNWYDSLSFSLDTTQLSTDSNGAHVHSVDGVTDMNQGGNVGNSQQIDVTNPYYSLCFIMKIANIDQSGTNPNAPAAGMVNQEVSYTNSHNVISKQNNFNDDFHHILFYAFSASFCLVFICCVFGFFIYKSKKKEIGVNDVIPTNKTFVEVIDQETNIYGDADENKIEKKSVELI